MGSFDSGMVPEVCGLVEGAIATKPVVLRLFCLLVGPPAFTLHLLITVTCRIQGGFQQSTTFYRRGSFPLMAWRSSPLWWGARGAHPYCECLLYLFPQRS